MLTRQNLGDATKRVTAKRKTWILLALAAGSAGNARGAIIQPLRMDQRRSATRNRWETRAIRAVADRKRAARTFSFTPPIGRTSPRELSNRLIPDGTNGAGEEPSSQYFVNIFSDFKPEDVPFRPAAAEAFRQRAQNFHEVVSPRSLSSRGHAAARDGTRSL